jgi:hypothetical protein
VNTCLLGIAPFYQNSPNIPSLTPQILIGYPMSKESHLEVSRQFNYVPFYPGLITVAWHHFLLVLCSGPGKEGSGLPHHRKPETLRFS